MSEHTPATSASTKSGTFRPPTWLLILVISAMSIVLFWVLRPTASLERLQQAPLPWNVKTFADGTSEVFQLHLGQVTVAKLIETLGEDHELAIISDQQDNSGLEVFYGHFQAGPIKGKLIARINADDAMLKTMQGNASRSAYIDSGSRKFFLNADDLSSIQSWTIAGLSFIPAANLKEDVVLARFGEPRQRIEQSIPGQEEPLIHFLYPDKGLHVAISPNSKELMQYVAPKNFERLQEPLQLLSQPTSSN